MLNLKEKKISVKIKDENLNNFYAEINRAFPFALNSIKLKYLDAFSYTQNNVPPINEGPLSAGDMVLSEGSALYYKIPKSADSVTIGQVSYSDDFSPLSDMSEKINDIFDKAGIAASKKWEEIKIEDNIIDSLKESSVDIKFDKNEIKTAGLLEDKFSYSLLKEIYVKKNTSLKALLETFGMDNKVKIEKELENFEKAKLVTKDYVILCRKSNQQILQVSSKAAIEETSQSSFKCFICGNPIASEEISEVITCSDFARKLLYNDYWLLIKFLNHLDNLNISRQDIFVQSDGTPMQKVFIRKNEKLIFVVICNRKLELNDSYTLSSIINTFNVPYVIMVSPENFTHLMKSYLIKNSLFSRFIFVEDLHNFEKEMNLFFGDFEKKLVENTFDEFSNLTYIDLKEAVLNKIISDARKKPAEKETANEEEKPKSKKKQEKDDSNE